MVLAGSGWEDGGSCILVHVVRDQPQDRDEDEPGKSDSVKDPKDGDTPQECARQERRVLVVLLAHTVLGRGGLTNL